MTILIVTCLLRVDVASDEVVLGASSRVPVSLDRIARRDKRTSAWEARVHFARVFNLVTEHRDMVS